MLYRSKARFRLTLSIIALALTVSFSLLFRRNSGQGKDLQPQMGALIEPASPHPRADCIAQSAMPSSGPGPHASRRRILGLAQSTDIAELRGWESQLGSSSSGGDPLRDEIQREVRQMDSAGGGEADQSDRRWTILVPSSSYPGDCFGHGMAEANGWLAISAPGLPAAHQGRGAVYLFRKGNEGWTESFCLSGDVESEALRFGESVAIVGDSLFIGAPGRIFEKEAVGCVYWYRIKPREVEFVRRLRGASGDGSQIVGFGSLVSNVHGELFVGSQNAQGENGAAPPVIGYTPDGDKIHVLSAPPEHRGMFGLSFCVTNGQFVVGDWLTDIDGVFRGAAFLYRQRPGSWEVSGRLTCPGVQPLDYFGAALYACPHCSNLLVGAPGLWGDVLCGAVLVYARDGEEWVLRQRLEPPNAQGDMDFGVSVAGAGGFVVIGAQGASHAGPRSGACYFLAESDSGYFFLDVGGPSLLRSGDRFGCNVLCSDTECFVAAVPLETREGYVAYMQL